MKINKEVREARSRVVSFVIFWFPLDRVVGLWVVDFNTVLD